jgi:hypothetical protein
LDFFGVRDFRNLSSLMISAAIRTPYLWPVCFPLGPKVSPP